MKITKNQIEEIRKLRAEGKTQIEIARRLNINQSSVNYWSNEESRKKQINKGITHYKGLSKEEKKEIGQKHREYKRNYYKNKYHTDEEYRKKRIEYSKKYQKSHSSDTQTIEKEEERKW